MQTQISTVFYDQGRLHHGIIFGYTSKSLPGLDITGFGQYGKIIKEKIVYLTRVSELKIPALRYHLCFDSKLISGPGVGQKAYYSWLELPCALLFWSLCKKLSIYQLTNCVCSGKLSANGQVSLFPYHQLYRDPALSEVKKQLQDFMTQNHNMLIGEPSDAYDWQVIDVSLLLKPIKALYWNSQNLG